MLMNTDLFNGIKLVKAFGLTELNEMNKEMSSIKENEELTQDEKKSKLGGFYLDFWLGSLVKAEKEVKMFLAGWKKVSYEEVNKTTAEEFMNLVEEFMKDNPMEELKDFFSRVLGLITVMR